MYEVTLSAERYNKHFLEYIAAETRAVTDEIGGISAMTDSGERSYVSFACDEIYAGQFGDLVKELSADVLIIGYKNLFIRDKLKIRGDSGFYLDTLINTMCVFDNNFDRQYVMRSLSIGDEVYLDGFFNFRMKRLKSKWTEVAELAGKNDVILSDKELIKEFLSYLLEAIPSGVKTLSVVLSQDNFQLFDADNKIMTPAKTLYGKATPEEEAMLNIICLKPKTVRLYSDNESSHSDFLELTEYLFDVDRVVN